MAGYHRMCLSLGTSQTVVQLDLLDKVFSLWLLLKSSIVLVLLGQVFCTETLNILDLFFNIEGLNTSTAPPKQIIVQCLSMQVPPMFSYSIQIPKIVNLTRARRINERPRRHCSTCDRGGSLASSNRRCLNFDFPSLGSVNSHEIFRLTTTPLR